MTKIKNQDVYKPDLKVHELDYLVGSDFDQNNKTVSFRVKELADFIGRYNGESVFNFTYYTNPDLNGTTIPDGYFFTKDNQTNPSLTTEIFFSKVSSNGYDMSDIFQMIISNPDFNFKLFNPNNPNEIIYYEVDTIIEEANWFKINVTFKYAPTSTLFIENTTYSFYLLEKPEQSNLFSPQLFTYTGGLQEFITTNTIVQVLLVFRNGKQIDEFTNTTTTVTVTTPLLVNDEILVVYASQPIGLTPFYTKAEIDTELNKKANILGQVFTGAIYATNLSGTNTGDNAVNTTSNAYADGKVAQTITNGVTGSAPSQDVVFDALATKYGGTVTTNTLPKATGANTFGNSNITDSGTLITLITDATINSLPIGRGFSNNITNTHFGTFPTAETGTENAFFGRNASNSNTTASRIVSLGRSSLVNFLTGTQIVSVGAFSANFLADGTTPFQSATNSTYVGQGTRASVNNVTNENVFGYNAIGQGSNSVTLGNSSITKTVLRGRVLHGTETDNGVDIGQFNGTVSGSPATLSNQFVTKAQLDAQKRRKDVTYFAANDIAQNTVLVGNFVCLLTKAYKIVEVSVVFGEQSMNVNKTIPFEIKTLDTDSVAPTATLQYTANVSAVVGAIQNKVYTFTTNITLPINKLLTVNTGAFTASTQILRNCLVTITLEEV
jgi:hypothetical protein